MRVLITELIEQFENDARELADDEDFDFETPEAICLRKMAAIAFDYLETINN